MQRKIVLLIVGLVNFTAFQYITAFAGNPMHMQAKSMRCIKRGAEGESPQLPTLEDSQENSEYGAAVIGAVTGTLLFPVFKGVALGAAMAGLFWFSQKQTAPNSLAQLRWRHPSVNSKEMISCLWHSQQVRH